MPLLHQKKLILAPWCESAEFRPQFFFVPLDGADDHQAAKQQHVLDSVRVVGLQRGLVFQKSQDGFILCCKFQLVFHSKLRSFGHYELQPIGRFIG